MENQMVELSAATTNVAIFVAGTPLLLSGLSASGIAAAYVLGTLTWRAFGARAYLLVAAYFVVCKPAPGTAAPLHVTRLDFGVEPNPSCKDAAAFPPQSLFFVHCFNNPAAVTALVLPSANLSSSTLQQLSIRANPSLSGVMPPQLVRLRSLQVLTISQNGLVRGEIPRGIGELRSLVHLDLSYNSLSGPVPTRISELKGLVGLDLSYNALSGPIPGRIGDLRQLQKLDLSSNNLTGGIPETVANLTSLTFLALSNNGLNGHFPPGLSALRNLQYLIMDNNPMGVPLPSELGSLARLQELRLAGSGYSGPIPAAFGQLASLTTLSLEDNNLTGEIPAGLSRLHRIYHLNLSNNGLGGAVPFDGAFLRRLGRNLDLSGNSGLCLDVVRDVGVGVAACHGGGGGSSTAVYQSPNGFGCEYYVESTDGSSDKENYTDETGAPLETQVDPDDCVIDRILQSLPPSYKSFVMNYNMQGMNKTIPELFAMLKAAEVEIKKEHQVLMVNKTTSFKKKGKGKKKGNFKKNSKQVAAQEKKVATQEKKPKLGPKPETECFYCKQTGHWKRNCPKYLADKKDGKVNKD
ncbi:LRR receptor-like serine/threonine-protein kinase ERECTA [Triticum urartu]|uniref:LRR receptor-like serine/threonine-protein kinase ERECTA n=1 Tax=Triticum urartu TaxID=4572 RepID=M7ZV27_TRIUA|nr:LRR receptor-like serine/threonine-protein kinase ERECTA [Triticum urartu]